MLVGVETRVLVRMWTGIMELRSRWGFDEYEVDYVEEVLEGLVESAGDII